MIRRHMVVWTVIVALLAALVPGSALAQEDDGVPVNCNGLSEDDCQIIQDAVLAMRDLESMAFVSSQNVHLDAGQDAISIVIEGSGAAVLPPFVTEFMQMSPPALGFMDLAPTLEWLAGTNSDTLLESLHATALHINLEQLEIALPDEPQQSVSAELLFKDGGLYIRMEAPNGADAWFGETLELSEGDLAEFDQTFIELQDMLETDEFETMMAQMSEYGGTMNAIFGLVDTYIVTTRGADETLHGQDMAAFSTTFDVVGLLSEPELAELITRLLTSPLAAELLSDADLGDLNQTQVQFFLLTAALLFAPDEIALEQWIGLDDGLVHRVRFGLDAEVDLTLFADASSGGEVDQLAITIESVTELDQHNAVSPDAFPVPDEVHDMTETDWFLPGTPDMIDAELTPGQSFKGALSSLGTPERDIYAIDLTGGDAVSVEITADQPMKVTIFGPDGFEIDSFGAARGDGAATQVEASYSGEVPEDGTYLIVVEGSFGGKYELVVRPE